MRLTAVLAFLATPVFAGVLLCEAAQGADMPAAPAYSPLPEYFSSGSWTGCYIGLNGGFSSSRTELTNVFASELQTQNSSGFMGGGQVGCDYQVGRVVVGLRNTFNGFTESGNAMFQAAPLAGYSVHSKPDWFDLLTARAGILLYPSWLFYVQGGGAWMGSDQYLRNPSGSEVGHVQKTFSGWTVGLGTEYMFIPDWSVFLEYNYSQLTAADLTFTDGSSCISGCSINFKPRFQSIMFGLNIRYGL